MVAFFVIANRIEASVSVMKTHYTKNNPAHATRIIICKSQWYYILWKQRTLHLVFFEAAEKIITSRNLKEYEDLLSEYNFFRIHKSYLVNLQEIQKYVRGECGQLIMSNGAALAVSKQRKEEFMNIYSGS